MMLRLAARGPTAFGLKVTLTVQLCPPPRFAPQVLVWLKSPGLPPEMVMLPIGTLAVPRLVIVTVLAELLRPTVTGLKVSEVGVTLMAVPMPVSEAVC